MVFQSLYRRYRPQTFGELLGQDHVATALRNAVREGRVGHSYLFSGPRGTGKTSTARILAKAINCTDRKGDGDPCSKCESCVAITLGNSLDVIELDAASNNGVAEMRSLLERVLYRTAGGERRVYIVDEVHMLSTGASNALLKTLEEPPEHIVFVLATTDPHKVLPTIRSRTQHFEFSLLTTDDLTRHLASVVKQEGVEASEEALALIARRGAGSARDALSFLDQALAHGDGRLEVAQVEELFGGTPFARRATVIDALIAEDAPTALESITAILDGGVEPRRVADDLLRYLRDTFLVSASRGRVTVEMTSEEKAQLERHGAQMGAAGVMRAMERLGDAAMEMRRAPDPRLVLEIALVRLARRDLDTSVDALLDRVARLERSLASGASAVGGGAPSSSEHGESGPLREAPAGRGPQAARDALRKSAGTSVKASSEGAAAPDEAVAPAATAGPAATAATEDPDPVPEAGAAVQAGATVQTDTTVEVDIEDVILAWPDVLSGLRPRLRSMAQEAHPTRVEGNEVVFSLPARLSKVHKPTIEQERLAICEPLGRAVGRSVTLRVELDESQVGDQAPGSERSVEAVASTNGDQIAGGVGTTYEESDESIDLSELIDAPPAELDSVDRMLTETFGARVEDSSDDK